MSTESYAVSPEVMAVMLVSAIGAAAMYSASERPRVPQLAERDDAIALQRLLNVLPIDITAPRYDMPAPQPVDTIKNHVQRHPYHANPYPTNRRGRYFSGTN